MGLDFKFVGFLGDVFLQDFGFGCLWVVEIYYFIKEFVNDDEVVVNRFFFECFEIFGKDFDDFMEEQQDFGGIGVVFCKGEEVKVVVVDIEILYFLLEDGLYRLISLVFVC